MTPLRGAFLLAAAFVAGAVNAVAGGGSFIAFPALLGVGFNTVAANVISTIGLVPGYLGSTVGYRGELTGQRHRMWVLGITGLVGGVVGAVLLLVSSTELFDVIVPWLVLGSCALLAAQPRLAKVVAARGASHGEVGDGSHQVGVHAAVFVSAVYGSYFGAGLGVVLLAVLGILLADTLQRLNGLKSWLSMLINGVAVIVFAVGADVDWTACAILAVGSLAGGHLGAGYARKLGATALRRAVVAFGLVIAALLFARL